MAKKYEKKIVYKETEVFDIFPKFEYTRRQRMRVTLFHGYAKNFKKLIHYASNFDEPNKLCLVYFVGEPKRELIDKELAESGVSDRVCVLTSPFPQDGLARYEACDDVRKKLRQIGMWDEESQFVRDEYLDDLKRYRKALKDKSVASSENDTIVVARFIETVEQNIRVAMEFRKLRKMSRNTYFKKFTLYRSGHLPKPFTHDKLDKLIERVFPLGSEAQGINDFAALSPIGVERAIKKFLTGEPDKKLGLDFDEDHPAVRLIRRYLNKEMDTNGCCSVQKLNELVQLPPLGLAENAYSAYCVALALKQYDSRRLFLFDSANSFDASDITEIIVRYILDAFGGRVRHAKNVMLYIESHPHKVIKRIAADLFGEKITMPGDLMLNRICRRIEREGYRYPLAAVDKRLFDLLDCRFYWSDTTKVRMVSEEVEDKEPELKDALIDWWATDASISDHEKLLKYSSASAWLWERDASFDTHWYPQKPTDLDWWLLKTRNAGGK